MHDVPQFDANGQRLSDTMTLEGIKLADGTRSVLMKNTEFPTTAQNGASAVLQSRYARLPSELDRRWNDSQDPCVR